MPGVRIPLSVMSIGGREMAEEAYLDRILLFNGAK